MNRRPDSYLAAWRDAHRELALLDAADPARPGALARVAVAWLEYQVAAGNVDEDEVVVVVDDDGRYVAVTPNVERVFGVSASDVVGRLPGDINPSLVKDAASGLRRLRRLGTLEGTYVARPPAQPVDVRFVAKADTPTPGLHTSRHRLLERDAEGASEMSSRQKGPGAGSWWDVAGLAVRPALG